MVLDWSPKKRQSGKSRRRRQCLPFIGQNDTGTWRDLKRLESELHRSCSGWRGEPTLCFIRGSAVGYTGFLLPSRTTLTSNPDSTLSNLVHHGSSFHKLPHKVSEKANVRFPLLLARHSSSWVSRTWMIRMNYPPSSHCHGHRYSPRDWKDLVDSEKTSIRTESDGPCTTRLCDRRCHVDSAELWISSVWEMRRLICTA